MWIGCTSEPETMVSNSTQCALYIGGFKKNNVISGVTLSFNSKVKIIPDEACPGMNTH